MLEDMGLLVRITDSKWDKFTCRLRALSPWEPMFGGLTVVVMSLSCTDIGIPRDDEKCRSMIYNVHQRSRHEVSVWESSSLSGNCV